MTTSGTNCSIPLPHFIVVTWFPSSQFQRSLYTAVCHSQLIPTFKREQCKLREKIHKYNLYSIVTECRLLMRLLFKSAASQNVQIVRILKCAIKSNNIHSEIAIKFYK